MNETNLDDIRATPEQIAAWQAEQAAKTEIGKAKELKFYYFPPEAIDGLVATDYAPAWKVAAAIYKQWYVTFRGNPVKLTSRNLRENYGVSKKQKLRALKILEDTGQYIIERIPGRNPSVTMKWKALRAPNQY